MRHRLIRSIGNEMLSATRLEKIALFLPFIVFLIDIEIFYYSFIRKETTIIIASSFVLILSVLEIAAVLREIHSHVSEIRKKDEVVKKIEEIIEKFEGKPTVKTVIEQFCETSKAEYPRSYLYHIVCDVLDKSKNKTKRV